MYLLGSIVIVEDIETGNRLSKKYNNSFRMVTLDGEDFAVGGATTGGSKPKIDASILTRDTLLNQATKELASLQSKYDVINDEVRDYSYQLQKLEEASKVLQLQLQRYDKELSASTEKATNTNFELDRLIATINKLEDGLKEKDKSLKEMEIKFNEENTKINEAE